MNPDGQMAALSLSLHSKQPKRAVIGCEKGYIEIMEYPRADRAIVVEAETGKVHEITAGTTADALLYENDRHGRCYLERKYRGNALKRYP